MDIYDLEEGAQMIFYRYFSKAVKEPIVTEKAIKYAQKVAKQAAEAEKKKEAPAKEKKVASFKVQNAETAKTEEQPELSLDEAIKLKRDASQTLKDQYDPKNVERYWNKWWETKKFYHVDDKVAASLPWEKKFVMVIPPPNVTGSLHIGHALTNSIEDTICRWKRMSGYATLWLPGVDHAGIATQSVVEKKLLREKNITRHDLGREKFLEEVFKWREQYGNRICEQERRMGISVDWDRFVFTMDPKMNKAVNEAFVRLFDRGLIYRSNRLVNWCCKLRTAISDIEVDYLELEKATKLEVPNHKGKCEFGVLIKFAYKVKDSDREIVVATTRIETMLGDTAVAVHSQDERYKDLIGKELVHPFHPNRHMKIITDDILVDPKFGTGCVKITPAHDFNDYECGVRNKLDFVNIFNDDGTLNDNGAKYQGMLRFECRNQILKDLEALGLLRGKEDNKMSLATCSRTGDIIEPMMRPQWYVNCQEISKKMIEVVQKKELLITPSRFEKTWYQWLGEIKDWCISRQIWWGHRVPAYLVTVKGSNHKAQLDSDKDFVAARNIEEAYEKAAKKFGVDKSQIELQQDEDVLDTWFSSGLFPFSSFGWPDESDELKGFFPGHVLETGYDILFFWVARMVMMSLLLTDKLPFTQVFLHPIVKDAYGRKMSKSLGNIIDPLDVISGCSLDHLVNQIKSYNCTAAEEKKSLDEKKKDYPQGFGECGCDALRYGLLSYMIQGGNINLDVKRIEGYRTFCNKIWNAFKLFFSKLPQDFKYNPSAIQIEKRPFIDRWILSKLNRCVQEINNGLQNYEFGECTISFQQFWLYSFCDVYLEAIKPVFANNSNAEEANIVSNILFHIVETSLRLLHPMMPFISEELYQKLPNFEGKTESISIASYPAVNAAWISEDVENQFEELFQVVKTVRSLASSVNLPNNIKPAVYSVFIQQDQRLRENLKNEAALITTLAKCEQVVECENNTKVPSGCIMGVCNKILEIHVFVKDHIKVDQEIERLEKKKKQVEDLASALAKKMAEMTDKVPESIRTSNNEKMEGYKTELAKLEESLSSFKKLL